MADIDLTPQVLDQGTIQLRDELYSISGPIEVTMASQHPPKLVIGDYGKDDQPFLSTYSVSDLRGGMGLWRWRGPEDNNRYWTAEAINTLHINAITLGPLWTDAGNPGAGVSGKQLRYMSPFNQKLVVVFDDLVYNWDVSWSALIDTLPALCTSMDQIGTRIFYGYGGGVGYSYQTAPGSAATDVASPNLISFVYLDDRIFALDDENILYSSTSGDSASWTTLATIPTPRYGDASTGRFLKLHVFDDATGEPALWALTSFGPFIYDPVNDKWFKMRIYYPEWLGGGRNNSMAVTFKQYLIIKSQDMTLLQLDPQNGTILITDISMNGGDGLPSSAPDYVGGGVGGLAATNDHVFAGLGGSVAAGTSAVDEVIFAWNGLGWHPLVYQTPDNGSRMWDLRVAPIPTGQYNLFFPQYVSGTGELGYFPITYLRDNPLYSSATYTTSGFIELSVFDGGYDAQQKTALRCRVKLNGASANETVQVAYRVNGSTGSYTNLGATVTSDTEAVRYFGTNNEGLAFKSIQFRLSFVRGTTTTLAPKLEYFAMDYIRIPEVLRGFRVKIDCTQYFNGRSPAEQIDDIWTIIGTNTLITFAYRDDTGNTRSYLVKALMPQGMEQTGYSEEGLYTLNLIEMSNP